ncbi:MAG: DUF309 domain-containing protein [Pirellulaceae bacterium]|jgi:hypothetical protein|nr:DUF309 domain-containing protein [Pirellulaceae bacterium]
MFAPDDPRYLRGIDLFNRGAYFDAHEVWEELWVEQEGPLRQFLQGLIQAAVCLHHFGHGNLRGAEKLCRSSTQYLRPFAPCHAGLNVDRLLAELAWCCSELVTPAGDTAQVVLRPDRVPRITLHPD